MISEYFGIDSDYLVLGLAALVALLILIMLISSIQMHSLKKKYKRFMTGKDGKNLEETILTKLEQVDKVEEINLKTQDKVDQILKDFKYTFRKAGLVKYDAFNEMGGKLSFSLALLNHVNDGFIINAMHSREGCYTYIKEIIDGNSVINLSEEEQEALNMALNSNK